jgi:hypothetical protein
MVKISSGVLRVNFELWEFELLGGALVCGDFLMKFLSQIFPDDTSSGRASSAPKKFRLFTPGAVGRKVRIRNTPKRKIFVYGPKILKRFREHGPGTMCGAVERRTSRTGAVVFGADSDYAKCEGVWSLTPLVHFLLS